jgi:hypothetical protein
MESRMLQVKRLNLLRTHLAQSEGNHLGPNRTRLQQSQSPAESHEVKEHKVLILTVFRDGREVAPVR